VIYYIGQFVSVGGARGLVEDIILDHPGNRYYWVFFEDYRRGDNYHVCVPEWSMRNVSGLWPWWMQRDGVPL